jgi:hypothetical protein
MDRDRRLSVSSALFNMPFLARKVHMHCAATTNGMNSGQRYSHLRSVTDISTVNGSATCEGAANVLPYVHVFVVVPDIKSFSFEGFVFTVASKDDGLTTNISNLMDSVIVQSFPDSPVLDLNPIPRSVRKKYPLLNSDSEAE